MEFIGYFTISFNEYCKANNLTEAPKEMIDKWRKDVIENYSKDVPAKMIIGTFNIPDQYKKDIEYHRYSIKEGSYQIDDEMKLINIVMVLKINVKGK